MPARQLVYEGTDLQELLQRVIDEHGPARIRPPERKRKGGVLGFFAREVYVITVDLDAPEAARPPSAPRNEAGDPAPAFAPSPLPGNPAYGAAAGSPLNAAAAGYGSTMAAEQGPLGGAVGGGAASVSSPLRALVEATEDEADLGSQGGARHTNGTGTGQLAENGSGNGAPYGGPGPAGRMPLHAAHDVEKPFGEVLSEVASSLGEEPGTYRPDPERLRRGRRGSANGQPMTEEAPEAGDHNSVEADSVEVLAPPQQPSGEEAEGGSFGLSPGSSGPSPGFSGPSPGSSGPTVVLTGDDATPDVVEDEAPPRRSGRHPVRIVPLQLPLVEVEEEREPPDLGATIVELLRAAGFPEHLLPRAPLVPETSTVEAVFAGLPEPPPLPADPGGLVAVVGSAGMVRTTANSVALSVGCPRDEVAVASSTASDRQARPEYRARTASQAAAMGPGWRRDRVGVVAVYAPPLGSDQRWTRQMLRALRPSCVWGIADATTKPDDVRRWAAAIGGVDALVMTDVGSTATPAAILSLGIPVARLDDEPATPARWAAVVAELVTKH
jgi:hypothetical protein